MRSIDWSGTPIGAVETWSDSIRMMVRFLLTNRFPLLLWWGPEYVQLYNDAYQPVLGSKHPRSMGQPARDCWSEIWHIIGPLVDAPYSGGPSTWMEDNELEIDRHGFTEESHFTIAYSPVPDVTAPSGIGGVLATVHEITEKVVAERRAALLQDLGVRSVTAAQTAETACEVAADILSRRSRDVPFALLYLLDQRGERAKLAGCAGIEPGLLVSPRVVDLADSASGDLMSAVRRAVATESMQTVGDLSAGLGPLPPGPSKVPPRTAVVLPIRSNIAGHPAGVFVAGVSALLALDDQHRAFFELLTAQIATVIANSRAYEEQKRRAEALAELDRAKTAFFSNVSHEFRTPLTLILGPSEDALGEGLADASARHRVEVIHRNALRLLKLVNSLLDVSPIEAGRIDATYVRTDLAAFTAQLASTFRSAIEHAGLRLTIETPEPVAPDRPVYVDRDMWENIVLNLVSNAFKHTFEGEIAIVLGRTADGQAVELVVRDTGVGIPTAQIPRLFERFHRVPNARSRTHDGAGIGLAMVEPQLGAKGISVEVDLANDLVVRADRDKVGQVLLNLLSNAVKFTATGGRVSIDAPRRAGSHADQGRASPDPLASMIFLRVSDTGVGVPREKQGVIFEPFIQLQRNLKRPTEGTGLGLAISRDLAHGMGGDLRVRSTLGRGSRFTLALRRATAPPTRAQG